MSTWTPTDRRIGMGSAIAVVVLTLLYIPTGAVWLVSNLDDAWNRGLEPSEPYLTILEVLLFLTAPAMVALFAAIHNYAPSKRKTCSLAAFGFVTLLAGLTGAVHFVQLTVVRRTTSPTVAEVFAFYEPDGKLSAMLAVDLLGWDIFLGFGLLFAAPIFEGDRLRVAIRASMILGGSLCLLGVCGPASGDLRLQYPGIVGYAFVFPFVCLLLAILFARSDEPIRQTASRKEP